jgi:DNA-binding LacI/PurR family transcriptional regulator
MDGGGRVAHTTTTRNNELTQRITLKDVATRAGVSQTTVSLYMNGNAQVCSPETAARIESAVTELNYVARRRSGAAQAVRETAALPPPIARRLIRTLGVAIPHSGDLLFVTGDAGSAAATARLAASSRLADQIWNGASVMAEYEDYGLLSYPASVRDSTDAAPFLDSAVAGVLLNAGQDDVRPGVLTRAGMPVLLLGSLRQIPDGCGAVYACESDIVELVLGHLWDLGHRRIAHLAGPDGQTEDAATAPPPSTAASLRLERYRAWMRVHAAFDPALEFSGVRTWLGDTEEDHGRIRAALETWMALPQPPTAIFCASDGLAIQLAASIHTSSAPHAGALALVGVGNSAASRETAGVIAGGLTSVALPGEQIGRESVRLLLRMIEGVPGNQCRLAVPVTQLVIRGSSASKN